MTLPGLYIHQKYDGKFVYVKELYSNREIKVHSSSRYYGVPGEIWFVRLFPDPFGINDYAVAFTTPYVIINRQNQKSTFSLNTFYKEADWLQFIKRSLVKIKIKIKIKVKVQEIAYYDFMKYGLIKHNSRMLIIAKTLFG